MKIIAKFEIMYYQYLNEQSELTHEIPLAHDHKTLLELYRTMMLVKTMDAKAIALQRTGKLGTYPSTRGQEAVFVGVGHAVAKDDVVVPYYRDMGLLVQRGVSFAEIFSYWGGDERGNHFKNSHDFPFCVPIASQLLHAAGYAFAMKYRKEKRAVLTVCGDGATSQGDFYEAINVAGVWKLPVVFIVCNNQWAISVPRSAQTKAETLAQKAIAAGIPGEQVDGNDIIAVRERTRDALEAARERGESRVLEMMCYRHCDHTTADDASRYEPKHLRETEWSKEPILRLRRYLEAQNMWNEQDEKTLQTECVAKVEEAVATYFNTIPEPASAYFDYLYAELPHAYHKQRDELIAKFKQERNQHG